MSWNYRQLGRTGVKVSPLCLGCMTFGNRTDQAEASRIVDRFLDAGLNFIDTANVYNRGESEKLLGTALQQNGKRQQVVLATKVFGTMDDNDPNMGGSSRRHITQQCDASLQRLGTDWIDLYQIHRPTSSIPIDETLRALDDLVRSGKVRYIGSSTFAAWQVLEALWTSKEYLLNRFVTEQPPYHLLDRRIERELIPMARTYGLGLLPWSPLAGGFLTGKYKRSGQGPSDARLAEREFCDAAFDVAEQLEELARAKGCSPSQLALAWCMQQPGITSPIIGPRNMDQLEDNLKALDIDLTEDDREKLDEVSPPGGAPLPKFYQADFGPELYR